MPKIAFNEFTKGMTDQPLDREVNRFELAENFLITRNGKLKSRPGSYRDNTSASKVNGTTARIGALIAFSQTMLKSHSRDVDYIEASVMHTLLGPTNNPVLGAASDFSEISFSQWNKHVYITSDELGACKVSKIYRDNSNALQVRTAGLPRYPESNEIATVTLSPSTPGTTHSYGYAFLYRYDYVREGDITFTDRGSPSFASITSADVIGTDTITGTDLQSFTNGASDNYDTANITLEIYRTIDGGNVYFLVKSVPLGTPTFTDALSDALLLNNEAAYFNNGIVPNDAPPVSRLVHMTANFGYYAYLQENGETLSNTIRQSKANAPSSVPGAFFTEIDDDIVGISSIRSVPIVFGTHSVYRLDGNFENDGSGGMTATKISDSVGGINQNSIVQTIGFLYFAGTAGFYRTDGFRVELLSLEISDTYSAIVATTTQAKRISGTFEPKENRIYWACSPTDNFDNDTILVMHLNFMETASAALTSWRGARLDLTYEEIPVASDAFNWSATAVIWHEGALWRAQASGHTFVHSDAAYSDERLLGDNQTWTNQPIFYDFKSGITSFGDPAAKKWVTEIGGSFENISNISTQIQVDTDRTGTWLSLPQVLVKDKKLWDNSYWGDPTLWTDSTRIPSFRRYMPPGSLRSIYKQIRFRSAFAPIVSSASRGEATLTTDGALYTMRLMVPGAQFVPDSISYYVRIEIARNAGTGEPIYSAWAEITQAPTDNLSVGFEDASGGQLAGRNLHWQIWGFSKSDGLKIEGFGVLVEALGDMLPGFTESTA